MEKPVLPRQPVPLTPRKRPVMEGDQMDYVLSIKEVQLLLLLEPAN